MKVARLLAVVLALTTVPPLTWRAAGVHFGPWSAPVNLGAVVNSASIDIGPTLSKDSLSLYFTSDRPGGFGSNDIWVSQRASSEASWGLPRNLGPVINTIAIEGVPAFSRDGHWMFFNSNRDGGIGLNDIWVSYRRHTHDDFGWEPPVNLGSGVNTPFTDQGASYFTNDDAGPPQLFYGSDQPGGPGDFDVFVSQLQPDGSFGPSSVVVELSSDATDLRPSVRFDGLEVFLFSNRAGSLGAFDLWVSTRATVFDPWSTPTNLGPIVNSTANDQNQHIASDRRSLYFASNRPGGLGSFDLWITTREKGKAGK
jgi:Tol biopolymer transport system component